LDGLKVSQDEGAVDDEAAAQKNFLEVLFEIEEWPERGFVGVDAGLKFPEKFGESAVGVEAFARDVFLHRIAVKGAHGFDEVFVDFVEVVEIVPRVAERGTAPAGFAEREVFSAINFHGCAEF
jgi:hypothetical protein